MDIQLYIGISYYMNRYVTRVGDLECLQTWDIFIE